MYTDKIIFGLSFEFKELQGGSKVQQAYAAMAAEDTCDYDQLKAAIVQRYSITEETYLVCFRSVACSREESYTEMVTRVMDLAQMWMWKWADVDELWEAIAVEQLLNSMPVELCFWVRERKPRIVAEAGRLADDYAHMFSLSQASSTC